MWESVLAIHFLIPDSGAAALIVRPAAVRVSRRKERRLCPPRFYQPPLPARPRGHQACSAPRLAPPKASVTFGISVSYFGIAQSSGPEDVGVTHKPPMTYPTISTHPRRVPIRPPLGKTPCLLNVHGSSRDAIFDGSHRR